MTCEYYSDSGATIPLRIHTVVVSTQHSPDVTLEKLREEVMEKVVKAVLPAAYLDERTVYHINPCGNFIIGGPLVSEQRRSRVQLTETDERAVTGLSKAIFVDTWTESIRSNLRMS